MAEHTPGPWEAKFVSGDVRHYSVPGDRQHLNMTVSWALGPISRTRLHAEADAVLIAAAPDMLATLRQAKDWLRLYAEEPGYAYQPIKILVKDIDKAIAKATGSSG